MPHLMRWQFERGKILRVASTEFDMLTHTQVQLLFVCTYSALRMCIHTYIAIDSTMSEQFEGGIYWDELAERCCNISRVAGFRGAAGNTVSDHYFVTVHLVSSMDGIWWSSSIHICSVHYTCSYKSLKFVPQGIHRLSKKFCFWWSMTHRTTPTNIAYPAYTCTCTCMCKG